jgi:broad specificity phosphatase PhoE
MRLRSGAVLIIVRHGRTDANAAGLLQGHLDRPLDPHGVEQAQAIAEVLAGVDRILTSPLTRARQTAAAIAERGGQEVSVDERWIELDYGIYDGVPLAEVPSPTWARWRSDPDFAPPGGESLNQLGARVRLACEALVAEAAESDIAVVSHVSPIKASIAWALDVGPDTSWRTHVATASIHRIAIGPRGPALHSFNETWHLPSDLPG